MVAFNFNYRLAWKRIRAFDITKPKHFSIGMCPDETPLTCKVVERDLPMVKGLIISWLRILTQRIRETGLSPSGAQNWVEMILELHLDQKIHFAVTTLLWLVSSTH